MADPRGAPIPPPRPMGPILKFCIHFHQKAPTSDIGTPLNGSGTPQYEILDLTLETHADTHTQIVWMTQMLWEYNL